MHRVFSLNLVVSFLIAALFTALFVLLGLFDLTGFLTKDPAVRPLFNRYLLGQAISILPLMLGNSLAAFLLLENKGSRTLTATLVFIVVNLLLNYLFVQRMRLEAFGLALAFSLGMWVFFGVQAAYFLSGRSQLRFSGRGLVWKESREILRNRVRCHWKAAETEKVCPAVNR